MEHSESIQAFFEYAARVLIWSFLMGFALLMIWFLLFAFGMDWMYTVQSRWFDMGKPSFYIINYCGMGLLKLSLIIFFLFPYLAIRIALRKTK